MRKPAFGICENKDAAVYQLRRFSPDADFKIILQIVMTVIQRKNSYVSLTDLFGLKINR